jgi:hypothetical protein
MALKLKSSTSPKAINVLEYFAPQFNDAKAEEISTDSAVRGIYEEITELGKSKLPLLQDRRNNEVSPDGSTDRIAAIDRKLAEIQATIDALNAKISEIRKRGRGISEETVIRAGKARGSFLGFLNPHDLKIKWDSKTEAELAEIIGEKLPANAKEAERIADRTIIPFDEDDLDDLGKEIAKPAADFDPFNRVLDPRKRGKFKRQTVIGPERVPSFGPVQSYVDPWALFAHFFPDLVKEHLAEKLKLHTGSRPVMTRREQIERLRELKEERLALEHRCEELIRAAEREGVFITRPAMDLQSRIGFKWKAKASDRSLDPNTGVPGLD